MAWIYTAVVSSVPIGLLMTAIMALAAFLFSSVAAYMAGLVGSSSTPVSGVTIATIMVASLLPMLRGPRSDMTARSSSATVQGGWVAQHALATICRISRRVTWSGQHPGNSKSCKSSAC
jgi:uncharacterized oligopeptide transporter (OPT) family protein